MWITVSVSLSALIATFHANMVTVITGKYSMPDHLRMAAVSKFVGWLMQPLYLLGGKCQSRKLLNFVTMAAGDTFVVLLSLVVVWTAGAEMVCGKSSQSNRSSSRK